MDFFPPEFKQVTDDLWAYTEAYAGVATTEITWNIQYPVQVVQITGNTVTYPDTYNFVIMSSVVSSSSEAFILYINNLLDVAEPVRKRQWFHEKFNLILMPGTQIKLKSGSSGAQNSVIFTWLFKSLKEDEQKVVRKCDIIDWLRGECVHGID